MLNYKSKYRIGQKCKVNIQDIHGSLIPVSGEIKSICYSYSFSYKVKLFDNNIISISNNAIVEEEQLEEEQEYIAHTISHDYYFRLIDDFYPCSIIGVEFFKTIDYCDDDGELEEIREKIKHIYR